MAPRFHELTLADVRPETVDAVALSFEISEDMKDNYAFTPGQYLTLRAEINGEDVRRSYSICSPVGSETLDVGVKRIEGGRFSDPRAAAKARRQGAGDDPAGPLHGAHRRRA